MKRHKVAFLLSLMLSLAVIFGCTQSTENTATSASETPLVPNNRATPVPSFTPLPTNLPVATFTLTAIPTLSVEAAQAKFLKFLSDNGGCHLPCLWGITPGISTYQEGQSIFVPLTGISVLTGFRSESAAIFPSYTKGDLELYNGVGFNVEPSTKIVSMIGFTAEAHKPLAQGGYKDVFDSKFFGDTVGAYTLAHVLTEQGVPSSVMIETAGGPLTRGGTGGFDILLLYPDQGILVNYKTQMHLINGNVRGCPLNAYVQMELYPSGQPNLFSEGLKQTDWPLKMTGYKSIEEATSMSVQEFYDAFRNPTDKCIETSTKLWPTPEP